MQGGGRVEAQRGGHVDHAREVAERRLLQPPAQPLVQQLLDRQHVLVRRAGSLLDLSSQLSLIFIIFDRENPTSDKPKAATIVFIPVQLKRIDSLERGLSQVEVNPEGLVAAIQVRVVGQQLSEERLFHLVRDMLRAYVWNVAHKC